MVAYRDIQPEEDDIEKMLNDAGKALGAHICL